MSLIGVGFGFLFGLCMAVVLDSRPKIRRFFAPLLAVPALLAKRLPPRPVGTLEVPDFRTRQQRRILQGTPGTWPQSRYDLKSSTSREKQDVVGQVIERLIQDTGRGGLGQEYGAPHLSLYRNLRDLLYRSNNPGTTHPVSNGFTPANLRLLTDLLWEQERRSPKGGCATISQTNPFVFKFPDNDKISQTSPSLYDSPHGIATAELARGYDVCVLRAQAAWTSRNRNQAGQPDMMAVLGACLADWCASYTPAPGGERRWAIYGLANDKPFTTRLAHLPARRECHMKDALLHGLSPHQVVETILLPSTGMFSDSPFEAGYSGAEVWSNSLLVCLAVWADYAGAADAKSSAGHGAFDILAAPALALAVATGPAAEEIKATIVTLFGAQLGSFRAGPEPSCLAVWRSRGYDGGIHASAAAIALTRGVGYHPEDERCQDLAAAAMAIHDSVDCEADVVNRTESNLITVSSYKGISVECLLDTLYATFAVNWTSTDIYGQLLLACLQEQASGARWGGPVYAAESRVLRAGGNLWKDALSVGRVASVLTNGPDMLPTTVEMLFTVRQGASWHATALHLSAQEILTSGLGTPGTGKPATMEEILVLSKGTLTLICCASCAVCTQDTRLGLDNWAGALEDAETSARVMRGVQRIRAAVDGPLRSLRAWLKADSRPDAIYRLIAGAFMEGTMESRYSVALVEALIIEDALYHGMDLLGYCVGWVPLGLHAPVSPRA